MLAAADAVAGYVARGRGAFDADPAVMDAVLFQLVVLGEAAKAALRADPSLRARFPAVPWSPVARVRDRAAHHYYKLDRDVVWDTATTGVPAAGAAIWAALGAVGPPPGWLRPRVSGRAELNRLRDRGGVSPLGTGDVGATARARPVNDRAAPWSRPAHRREGGVLTAAY